MKAFFEENLFMKVQRASHENSTGIRQTRVGKRKIKLIFVYLSNHTFTNLSINGGANLKVQN